MNRTRTITLLVAVSLLAVMALPVISYTIIMPAYGRFLTQQAEAELVTLASNMSSELDLNEEISDTTILPMNFLSKIEEARSVLGLFKIKIFTPQGHIIYSTNSEEIGTLTRKIFFKELIKEHKTFSLLETKNSPAEGSNSTTRFLVETYVPILAKNGAAIGAFEIYYDITSLKSGFEKILVQIQLITLSLSFLLLLSVLLCAHYATRSFRAQKAAEEEKDRTIIELQDALGEINSLRGILPLCSYCKDIRNDKGYWEKVDVYIQHHSQADISHSICPNCAQKHFPNEYKSIAKAHASSPGV